MKRIYALLIGLVFSINLMAAASGIEVLPTMYTRSNEQDRVWVGTFQLVWNDFMDKIIHNPVRFRDGAPIWVYELNKQTFKASDLSEKSYYKII